MIIGGGKDDGRTLSSAGWMLNSLQIPAGYIQTRPRRSRARPPPQINVGCARTLFYCAQPPVPRLPIYIKGETHLKLEIPSTLTALFLPSTTLDSLLLAPSIKQLLKFSTPNKQLLEMSGRGKGGKVSFTSGLSILGFGSLQSFLRDLIGTRKGWCQASSQDPS